MLGPSPSALACSQSTSGTVYHPARRLRQEGKRLAGDQSASLRSAAARLSLCYISLQIGPFDCFVFVATSQCKFFGGRISLKQ